MFVFFFFFLFPFRSAERVEAMQTVMKAFGSATSVIHDNATRYTSLTSFEFDTAGVLVGGNLQVSSSRWSDVLELFCETLVV